MSSSDPSARAVPRVRMESPDALFAPDHYVETPIPAPLYLLNCIRLPLDPAYATREDGTVINPGHAFQRNEILYPDGSRFWAEISASPTLGLPSVYDLDYLLGLIRIADQGGVTPDGRLSGVTYSDILRATRSDLSINGQKVQGVKRALGRWANTTIRSAMEMSLEERAQAVASGQGHARPPAARPGRREREATYWVLEYDWESERVGSSSRDVIGLLRLNPIWRAQTDIGLAAWIDVEVHNSLTSSLAKGIYLRLVLAAAQGQQRRTQVLPLERWMEILGVDSKERPNKIAKRFAEALSTLREVGVLDAAEVISPRRGRYEIVLEPGQPIRDLAAARGIGSLDPVRTRTLVYHLGRLGFMPAEARTLLAQHGLAIQRMLQRVHYERTVKKGTDAKGEPILRWELWIGKGLKQGWKFEEPEYLQWLHAQERRFLPSVAPESPAAALPAPAAAASPEPAAAPEPLEIRLPDNVWGQAIARLQDEVAPEQIRTWLLRTWLFDVSESVVQVGAEDSFTADWVSRKWGKRLETELASLLGRAVRLRITAETEGPFPSV